MVHEKILYEYSDDKKSCATNFIKEKLKINDHDKKTLEILDNFMNKYFFFNYFRFWKIAHRNNSFFIKKFSNWLRKEINFDDILGKSSKNFSKFYDRNMEKKKILIIK